MSGMAAWGFFSEILNRCLTVFIEYAGADNGISSANCRPTGTQDDAALTVGDFSDQYVPPVDLITNSFIRYSKGFGINAIWHSAEIIS